MRTIPVILSLSLAASAVAAAPRPDPNMLPTPPVLSASPAALLIAGMDANGDSRVRRAERARAAGRLFAGADSDHDGALTLIELADWSYAWLGDQSAVPGRFDFDRDADDKISRAEFVAELDRRFAAFDKNGDGVVERSELLTIGPQQQRGPSRRR